MNDSQKAPASTAIGEHLTLKWGTLKSWHVNEDGPAFAALKRYHEAGPVSWGAAQQHDTPEQKAAICEIIDALDAESVYLDWDGKSVSKEEAKEYVMNYGTKP
jgi:hypothetical protein